ncbi:transposase [Stakelama saccharophila]|uniref:Transposase n=1 Tax=Stakelama saccharophila TaxID=3075605 RepID=A0ABZ0B9G9_9SPHN|nr:transposase [Stakelama sp. W311]WNO53907.1 transposase [Stakelama sp. W311]
MDVRDEDAFAALGPALARLSRNRDFLAELAVAELKRQWTARPARGGYGPQLLLLRPPDGRFVLRANFWPAREDAVTRHSGPATFFYDLPHDHNFPFLTVGYHGPGYWSDYYEVDGDAIGGLPGDPARLRFTGRACLSPGTVMLYRMRRDVHVQLPPDRFSVSLNILGVDPEQPWLDQYRFDIRRNCIAEAMTTAPAEPLVTLAAQLGGNGRDLAERFAAEHPCDRMRWTAFEALASASADPDAALAIYDRAAASARPAVARRARARLAESAPDRMRLQPR